MKIILFALLINCCFFNGFAQEYKTACDQWRKEMDQISEVQKGIDYCHQSLLRLQDPCRVKVFVEIGLQYANKLVIDSSLYYMDRAIQLAQSIEANEELSYAYSQKTEVLVTLDKYQEGKELLKQAKELIRDFPNSTSWINYYDKKGYFSFIEGDYETAITYMDSTILASKKSGYMNDIHQTYENLGVLYMQLNDFEKAVDYFIKSISIKEKQQVLRDIGGTYRYLALCYNKLQNYKTAKKYAKIGVRIGRKDRNNFSLMSNYVVLAKSNRKLYEYPEALKAVDSAVFFANKMNSNRHLAAVYTEKGEIFLNGYNDTKKAVQFFEKAYYQAKETKVDPFIFRSLRSLANLYIQTQDNNAKLLILIDELETIIRRNPQISFRAYLEKVLSEYNYNI